MVKPLKDSALAKSSVETSGFTCMRMVLLSVIDRGEVQPDAEFAELNRDRAGIGSALQNRNRKFAAHQEAGFFAVGGHQIRLRQNLQQVAALQRLDQNAPRFRSGRNAKMFSASEMVKVSSAAAYRRAALDRGRTGSGELAGGDAPDGVGGSGGNQIDAELRGGRAVQLGELHPQQDLFLDGRRRRPADC